MASALPALFGLGFVALFTRVFTAGDFGRFALVASLVSLSAALASQWLQQGLIRFLPGVEAASAADALSATVLGLTASVLAVALISVPIGVVVATRAGALWRPFILPAVGAAASLTVFNGTSAVLQSRMDASRYRRYRVLEASIRFALAAGLVFLLARRVHLLLWAQACSGLLLAPFMWRAGALPSPRRVATAWRASWPRLRALASYGLPLVGWYVAATVLDVGDRYIIAMFRGAREVGVYSANYGLVSGAVGLMAAPVLLAAHPFLMRAWNTGNRGAASRWLAAIVEWFAVAGLVLTAGLWMFARDVAGVLLGAEFREGYLVMPLALAGLVVWQLGMYTHKPLEFLGQTRTMLLTSVAVALANVGLNVIFVPHFGYIAAAYTTLACYAGYLLLTFVLGRRVLDWRPDVGWLGRAAGLTAVVSWVVVLLASAAAARWGGWTALAIKGSAVVVAGLGVLKILPRRLHPAEHAP